MPLLQSPSITALASALCVAQAHITAAVKDATNPHFKTKYADLASVWAACRTPLGDQGLSVYQGIEAAGSAVTVTTLLLHKSGEYLGSSLTMTANPATPQGLGSCITYARRYALAAAVGVAPEDDDGNSGSNQERQHQAPPPRQSPPPPPPVDVNAAALQAKRAKDAVAKIKKALGDVAGNALINKVRAETEGWDPDKAIAELEKTAQTSTTTHPTGAAS